MAENPGVFSQRRQDDRRTPRKITQEVRSPIDDTLPIALSFKTHRPASLLLDQFPGERSRRPPRMSDGASGPRIGARHHEHRLAVDDADDRPP